MTKKASKIDTVLAKKEWNKNKTEKKIKNPLTFKHYVFWICQSDESLKKGYLYYLFTKTYSRRILTENESPKFKSAAEALAFAANNKLTGFIPG